MLPIVLFFIVFALSEFIFYRAFSHLAIYPPNWDADYPETANPVKPGNRENAASLWHWTVDPRVPAKNNAAERAIRPLAIARKVSHGSQSFKGRETRGVLMSVLHTLHACCTDPARRLAKALDRQTKNRRVDMFACVFGSLPLYIPTQ